MDSSLAWNTDDVKIFAPVKKSKEVCTCKVMNQSDGEKPVYSLKNATLLQVEDTVIDGVKHQMLVFRLYHSSKSAIRGVVSLDAFILKTTVENSKEWFQHDMKKETIRELYKGLVHYDAFQDAPVIRCVCLPSSKGVPSDAPSLDVDLQLVNIVFKKQQFFPRWKILRASPSQSTPAHAFLEDDDDASVYDASEALPTHDEYLGMIEDLENALSHHLGVLRDHSKQLHEEMQKIEGALKRVARLSTEYDVQALNELTEQLATLTAHSSSCDEPPNS